MLRAIAVYEWDRQTGNFNRICEVEKPGSVFAPNHDLAYFDGNSLPELRTKAGLLSGEKIFSDLSVTESVYYYARFVPDTNHLHVLISRKELHDLEPYYLLVNVNHAEQGKVSFKLTEILRNPIGYTGRDMLPGEVLQKIEKVKVEALNAKAALDERGEKVETAQQRSEVLFGKSLRALDNANRVNDEMSCCGGWLRSPFKR
ncbi:MAG TPA: hypothetical protein VL360_06205 [Gammaproteobacteria bacterium]|jgi:hypothetical protein|nr:hypothetical protein [Gammaproteobacteria bacterium]